MKRAEPLLIALILVAATALRLVALHADPPAWLSWSAGLYSDEGIYSEDARLLVLYGQHMQGDFQIAAVAPLHYHLLVWVFRHVETISLATVRIVSVAFSAATLLCFWAAMRLTYGAKTATIGLTLLSFSAPFLLYNRMGLLEMPAVFWLTAAFLAFAAARDSADRRTTLATDQRPAHSVTPWLSASGLLAGIGVDWKGTFALGACSLLVAAALLFRWRALAAVFGAALAVLANFVIFQRKDRAEISRVDRYYLLHQYLPHTSGGVWHNLGRSLASGTGDGALIYLVHFAPVLLLLTVAAALFPRLRSSRDTWLWLWLALPLCAMLVINYSPSRYFVQFWPALAGLAACALARAPRRLIAVSGLTAAICMDACLLGVSYVHRTYTIQQDARIFERVLPRDAWIAGQFAPTVCMECSLRSMYVQQALANDSPDTLRLLPITHVLATRVESPASDPWRGKYTQMIAAPDGLRTLPIGPKIKADLYANLDALP